MEIEEKRAVNEGPCDPQVLRLESFLRELRVILPESPMIKVVAHLHHADRRDGMTSAATSEPVRQIQVRIEIIAGLLAGATVPRINGLAMKYRFEEPTLSVLTPEEAREKSHRLVVYIDGWFNQVDTYSYAKATPKVEPEKSMAQRNLERWAGKEFIIEIDPRKKRPTAVLKRIDEHAKDIEMLLTWDPCDRCSGKGTKLSGGTCPACGGRGAVKPVGEVK